jgi:hypothetical protein
MTASLCVLCDRWAGENLLCPECTAEANGQRSSSMKRDPLTDAILRAVDCADVYGHEEQIAAVVADSLDAAWAEAEAALPEGAYLVLSDDPRYTAEATREGYHHPAIGWVGVWTMEATGPTPTAALRALAAKLRERGA